MKNPKTMQERREEREWWIAEGILPPAPTHQRCTHCLARKPMSDFPVNQHVKDGRSSWCKSCHNGANRAWRAKLKGKRDA